MSMLLLPVAAVGVKGTVVAVVLEDTGQALRESPLGVGQALSQP